MELIERINVERLRAIENMSPEVFRPFCTTCKNEKEREEFHAQVNRFITTSIAAKGEIKRLYKYPDAIPNEVGGRLYSGGSIQGVPCPIRGYLVNGTCTDIDMKNAQPTLLLNICRKHNIHAPHLEKYCANRDDLLAAAGHGAKQLYLKTIYSDSVNRTIKDTFFNGFDKEMKDLQKQIVALPEYKHIVASVPFCKATNRNGSALSRILGRDENVVLQRMVGVLTVAGIEIMSLMFDGCLVYGDFYDNLELLTQLESATAEYGIKLAYKRHDTSLNLAEISAPAKKEEGETDQSCAESILKKFPHFKFCQGEFYAYNDRTGMWSTDPIFVQQLVSKYGGMYTTSMMRRKMVISCIKPIVLDDEWAEKTEHSGLRKLLFKDGVYDSETRELNPFNPDVVFFARIAFNFPRDLNTADIRDRFFTKPLGDGMAKYMLGLTARALMGYQPKNVLFGLGESGAGKSIIVLAYASSVPEYVGTFDAGNLAFDKSTRDSAAKNRWAMILRHKRVIFSNEIKSTESIDGNAIKKLASGGDIMVGRNHGGAETQFAPHFMAVVMANDMPKITPYDDAVNNRLRVVSYNKRFVEHPVGPDELQMDPSVGREIKTVEFQQTFVALLIESFHLPLVETEEVLNAKKEWVVESPSVMDAFLGYYEFTNDPTDFIPTAEMQHWLKGAENGITLVKLGKEVKAFADKNGHTNYVNKPKKINGKAVQCYFGIRERRDEVERPMAPMAAPMEMDCPYDEDERDPEAEYQPK